MPTTENATAVTTASTHQPTDRELLDDLIARFEGVQSWAKSVNQQLREAANGIARAALAPDVDERLGILAEQVAAIGQGAAADDPGIDPAIGYAPTGAQQMELFQALAEWQVKASALEANQIARVSTKTGGQVEYAYSDIAAASEVARTAGAVGLCHFHRQIKQEGVNVVRTYLAHKGGGYTYCDVPVLIRENSLNSGMQSWASAVTMARRYGLYLVMGIAVDKTGDDDGASAGPGPATTRPPAAARPQGPPTQAPVRRGPASPSQPRP